MGDRPFTEHVDDHGRVSIEVHARGMDVLDNPQLNRGSAFTSDERALLGLEGMLPPAVETVEEQLDRCYEQFSSYDDDIDRWLFLTQLHDFNEVLFYRLVGEHVTEMLPDRLHADGRHRDRAVQPTVSPPTRSPPERR